MIYICGITLLIRSNTNTATSLHFAEQHNVFPVVGNIIEKVFSAALSIILLIHGAGVITMAFVLLESAVISGIWQAIWYYRFYSMNFPVDFELIRELLRTGLPFLAYGVITIIYYRIDTVLLSLLTSVAVVGWYGAAYRLFDTMTFLPSLIISAIMYPLFSRLTVTSEENPYVFPFMEIIGKEKDRAEYLPVTNMLRTATGYTFTQLKTIMYYLSSKALWPIPRLVR